MSCIYERPRSGVIPTASNQPYESTVKQAVMRMLDPSKQNEVSKSFLVHSKSITLQPAGNWAGNVWSRDISLGGDSHFTRLIADFKGHSNAVRSVSFSRDGTRLVSGSWDMT
eukprot:gene496-628_t